MTIRRHLVSVFAGIGSTVPGSTFVLLAILTSPSMVTAEEVPFAARVYALQDYMRAGPQNVPPEMPGLLHRTRREALDYTRGVLAREQPLCRQAWSRPLVTLYGWSHTMEWTRFEDAHRECTELLDLLRSIDGDNALLAANTAIEVLVGFASKWMVEDAPAMLQLMDDTEVWVLALTNRFDGPLVRVYQHRGRVGQTPIPFTSLPETWYRWMSFFQANILHQEHQFAPEQRPWLWQSRQERIHKAAMLPELPLDMRMRFVAHWGDVLFLNGRGQEAETLLLGWMRMHPDVAISAYVMQVMMKITILDAANWERASQLLAFADEHSDRLSGTLEQEMYRRMTALYYELSVLPEYELLRRRHLRERQRLERLQIADTQHVLPPQLQP